MPICQQCNTKKAFTTSLINLGFYLCGDCFIEEIRTELDSLKKQLAEYEETSSQTSEESFYSNLATKIAQKKQELQTALTSSKKNTKYLRKEIELLEKIQELENKISEHQTQEATYRQQIREKEEQVQIKQEQINALEEAKRIAENNLSIPVATLRQQIDELQRTSQAEKNRLQQELTNWQNAKQTSEQTLNQTIINLRTNLTQLTNISQQEKQDLQKQITELEANLKAKTEAEKKLQEQKARLEKQVGELRFEKSAIEEKMLKERQEVLRGFEQEKANLTEQIKQLKEARDTFRKSADYLRSTLKETERSLEASQTRLSEQEKLSQEQAINQQATLEEKNEELRQKQEAFKVIQERNSDLQGKLAMAQEENQKLTEWISKLESVSAEGDAFTTLQGELAQSKQTIQELEEQLSSKQPRSYWWLYLLLGLVALYLMVS